MTNPLNDLPRDLSPEALQDLKIWRVAIAGMKGKQRLENIKMYIDRTGEVPQLPILRNPI